MATNIFKFDGSLLTTIPDNAIDQTHASIKFPGRGYQNYGQPVLENILWVMENFAGGTAPILPLTGQLWYDTSAGDGSGILKVYNGADWQTAGGVIASDVPPTSFLSVGSFWYDTLRSQLNIWNGQKWDIVGPLGSSSDVYLDPTDPIIPSNSVIDAITVIAAEDQQPRKLWRITVGGVLLAIISKDPVFTPQSTIFTNNSFQKIYPGLNFNNGIAGIGISGDQTVFKSTQDNLPNFDAQWSLGSGSRRFNNIYGMRGFFSTGVGINTSPGTFALNVNGKSSFRSTVTLGAGSASAPPLKLTEGNNANPVQLGAIEFDGTDFYFTGRVNGIPTRQTPLFSLAPLESKSFFVSSTVGNDANNGLSRVQPFKTIKKALSVAVPGTSIFIESGEYLEQNPLYVPPRVSIVGDNLRRVLIRPVHDQLDLFHVNVNSFFFGMTFKDHRSPAFCFAFPCSLAVATVSPTTTGPNVGNVIAITSTYSQTFGDFGSTEDQYATGYSTIPDIYIEAPPVGAIGQARAVIDYLVDGGVADIIVTDGGSGYNDALPPTVVISGGAGTGAEGRVRIQNGSIVAIDILNCGRNYTYPVTVTLSSETPGTGAAAKVLLGNGMICTEAIRITNPGYGYDRKRPPLISIKPIIPATITSSPYVQNCSSITGPFDANGKLIVVDGVTLSLPYTAETLADAGYTPWNDPELPPDDNNNIIGVDPTGAGGGIRIDGEVLSSDTVIRSFVADSFTQLNQGGIGHLIINKGYTQFVSCFTTFSSIGYWARGGGFANISNSVIDFGDIGVKAEGFYPIPYTDGDVQLSYYSKVSTIELISAGDLAAYLISGTTPSAPTFFYMTFDEGIDPAIGGLPARGKVEIDINGQVSGVVLESLQYSTQSLLPGVQYTIENLGDPSITDWNLIAGLTSPTVGTTFICIGNQPGSDGLVSNVGGGKFVFQNTDSIELRPGPGPSDNPNNITINPAKQVGLGQVILETPQTIKIKTGINERALKPEVGSALLYEDKFYTILNVTGDDATDMWDVEFTPPIISINQFSLVSFHNISNISTGGLALEYVGSGVTYNALPYYGGVPDINKQVVDRSADIESTPISQRKTPGVVYYVTIDNTGNFKIGPFFGVNFIDGTIKLGADAKLDLTNLISIGPFRRNGVSVGTSANEISDDTTMTHAIKAYDRTTIPTQNAVRTYIAERISTNVMPDQDNLRSIGGTLQRWKALNAVDVTATNVFTTNSRVVNGNITTLTSQTAVFGTITVNGAVVTNGAETKNGPLTVNGQVTINSVAGSTTNINSPTFITRDTTVNGNLTVTGTSFIFNTNTYVVSDPAIEIGSGVNNAPLPSDDGLDRGMVLHYYNSDPAFGTIGDNHAFVGRQRSSGSLVYITNIAPGATTIPNPLPTPPTSGTRWGTVQVGDTTVRGTLAVTGSASFGGGATFAGTSTITGDLNVTGDITAFFTSDEKLKHNVKTIPNAIEKVSKIGGYTFDWNDLAKDLGIGGTDTEAGVLAQEVEKVMPEVVTTRETGFKAVRYEKLVPLLIQAIKELTEKVNKLENK